MADGLPEGLVTNTEAISGDIQSVDRIAAEDLAHLWRGNLLLRSTLRLQAYTVPQCIPRIRVFWLMMSAEDWRTFSGESGAMERYGIPSEATV